MEKLINKYSNLHIKLWAEDGKIRYKAPAGALTEQMKAELKENKASLIEYFEGSTGVQHDEENAYQPFPLTDIQAAYLVGQNAAYGYGGVGCKVYLELTADGLDYHRLQEAWNEVVERHPMLRAVIWQKGTQRILADKKALPITLVDKSEDKEKDDLLLKVREEYSLKQYQPEQWPLYDIILVKQKEKDTICFAIDMLIADFSSIKIIMDELEKIYYGKPLAHKLNITFRDVVMQQQNKGDDIRLSRAGNYWLERLEELPGAPELPVKDSIDDVDGIRFDQYNYWMASDKWERFNQAAKTHNLTATSVVLTMYANVIRMWSGQDDFCINVTMANREGVHEDVKRMVGDFTVVDILQINMDSEINFLHQAQMIQKRLWEDQEHIDYSGVSVLRELKRIKGEDVLFPVVFTSTIGGQEEKQDRNFALTYKISQTPQVWIDCQVSEENDAVLINWDVRAGIFPDGMIAEAFSVFERQLDWIADNGEQWQQQLLQELPPQTINVRTKINDTKGEVSSKLIYEDIINQIKEQPDNTAIIWNETTYSYGTFADYASAIQAELLERGIKKGDIAAVNLEKGIWQVAAIVGILWAGAAYVPLDVEQPGERKEEILQESGCRWMITSSKLDVSADVGKVIVEQLKVTAHWEIKPVSVLIEEPAYVIYTSGSTGKPKGVVISHQAAVNTIADINERFAVTGRDRVLAVANIAFDLSVYDIFGILSAGGALVIPDQSRHHDPKHWEELISRYKVTIWNSVPAQMQMLTMYMKSLEEKQHYDIRLILLSGDWISVTLPAAIDAYFTGYQLISLGGATEAAIWSIYYPVDTKKTYKKSIPYGVPLKNQYFRILNKNLQDCPDWVTGDLYIGGLGLATEYLNDGVITSQKFILHPNTGERLYFTGDMGRYWPDGTIEFIGRSDSQIKVHGHRIEIKEIESNLEKSPSIEMAAVVVNKGKDNENSLAAFVSLSEDEKRHITCVSQERLNQSIITAGTKGTAGIDRELFGQWADIANQTAIYDILNCLRGQNIFNDETELGIEEIQKRLNIHPYYHQLLRRWINALCKEKVILKNDQTNGYQLLNKKINEQTSALSWQKWWEIEKEMHYGKRLVEYFKSSSDHLLPMLQGEVDSLDLFFPKGDFQIAMAAYHDNLISQSLNKVMIGAIECLISQPVESKTYRILEVGAGVGGASLDIIPALTGRNVEYVFTDVSQFFLNEAQKRLEEYPFVKYGLYDINKSYWTQGIKSSSFDIIICNNVLHNARILPDVMESFREILVAGGAIIVADTTGENYSLLTSMEFHAGLNSFEDFRKENDQVFLTRDQWFKVFADEQIELAGIYPTDTDPLCNANQAVFVGQFVSKKVFVSAEEIKQELKEKIPQYMIPKHIEIVERIPLTVNGKVDREELAKRLVFDNPFVAVAGKETKEGVEKNIEQIWAKALNRQQIWRDENFYQAGGDSLLLAQIVSEMKENIPAVKGWEWDKLISEIIQSPTIAGIVAKILKQEAAAPQEEAAHGQSSLQILDTLEESVSAKVLLHDGTGTLTPYDSLLPYLLEYPDRKERLIGFHYGTEEQYLNHSTKRLIQELGVDCAKKLLEFDIQEFELIGYCMGGLVAVETAKYLIQEGKTVKPVIAIDTTPCDSRLKSELLMERTFGILVGADLNACGHVVDENILKEALIHLLQAKEGDITTEDLCALGGKYQAVANCYKDLAAQDPQVRIDSICGHITRLKQDMSEFQKNRMQVLYKVFCKSFAGMSMYQNEFFTGDVKALSCKDKRSNFLPVLESQNSEFWREITLGNLDIIPIEGDHISCMQDPQVAKIGNLIMLGKYEDNGK